MTMCLNELNCCHVIWLNRLFFLSAGVPKEVSGECVSIPDTVLTEGPSLIKLGSF